MCLPGNGRRVRDTFVLASATAYGRTCLVQVLPSSPVKRERPVLKISVIDTSRQRNLVVEGKLIFPWAAELKNACETRQQTSAIVNS
jgi:hypothetical protein